MGTEADRIHDYWCRDWDQMRPMIMAIMQDVESLRARAQRGRGVYRQETPPHPLIARGGGHQYPY